MDASAYEFLDMLKEEQAMPEKGAVASMIRKS